MDVVLGSHAVHLEVPSSDAERARAAIGLVTSSIQVTLNQFDAEQPDSPVATLNSATQPVVPPSPMGSAIELCLKLARETNGAIDPTLGFLRRRVWRFGEEKFAVPTPLLVIYAQPFIGWRGVMLRHTAAGPEIDRATPYLSFDLSIVAVGTALEHGADTLRQAGLSNFLLACDGRTVVHGTRGRGAPWTVEIQHPRRKEGIHFAHAILADESLATVGDYQQYAIAEGMRYHSILDPRTGYPSNRAISASVIAPTPAVAEALATAAFVLGETGAHVIPDAAQAVGVDPARVSVLLVLPNGRTVTCGSLRWQDVPEKLTLLAPADTAEP